MVNWHILKTELVRSKLLLNKVAYFFIFWHIVAYFCIFFRSYVWDRRSPETITATPAIVPCRLKQKVADADDQSLEETIGCTSKNKDCPQPLQSLLNDLVGSQDPLDPLLINTKAVIHHEKQTLTSTSNSNSRNSSARSSESENPANINVVVKRCHSVGSSIKSSEEGKDSDYVPMMNNVNCCATLEPETVSD